MSPRIVIVAHAHPRLSQGGGEIAAHRQYAALRAAGEDAWFLGIAAGEAAARLLGAGAPTAFAPTDLCLAAPPMDGFELEQPPGTAETRLVDLLERLDGDIYHFHHFWNVGAGTLRRLRARRPQARLVLTLHEMLAICALHGQMVKSWGQLCHEAGPLDCAACMAGHAPLDFVTRRARMLELLAAFDVLIAPSRFLAGRLEAWGVPEGRIRVIENGLPPLDPGAEAAPPEGLHRRFGFFGNATPTKGLDVLVGAARLLAADPAAPPLSIEVHGVDAAGHARLWPGAPPPPMVAFRGRYRPEDAVALMRGVGWVVVPSTWWENAPVVIDEARAAGRPVIASGIGGMAEKTAGWGLTFPVGDAAGLAALMARLAAGGEAAGRWAERAAGVPPPVPLAAMLGEWRRAVGLSG